MAALPYINYSSSEDPENGDNFCFFLIKILVRKKVKNKDKAIKTEIHKPLFPIIYIKIPLITRPVILPISPKRAKALFTANLSVG